MITTIEKDFFRDALRGGWSLKEIAYHIYLCRRQNFDPLWRELQEVRKDMDDYFMKEK